MGRYDYEDNVNSGMTRQRDLVLASNEFIFIQSKTNGSTKTYTGPITATISAQESLVTFNSRTKKFEETNDFERAKQLFVTAPEGWYVTLKNPSKDGSYPEFAKAVNSPALNIGRKVNIAGPVSFSLFPGQMAKVVRGHRLRSNQYLLARVYDAVEAEKNMASATVVDAEGKEIKKNEKYYAGQLLVIKGTEVSFYMPPTGIEVIPVTGHGDIYVRDAITLERLEYAILKDEDGEKRYMHGPSVVFPKPTETFVEAPKGGAIFRALELSPISGIYIKVIADYEENGVKHPTGEELFITGNDQMIYYPRPEHAMIQYDGKYMHHAIAIPEGEGRYILNRLTGEIKTIHGPKMYLPDPRTEVVVKRKLTPNECHLMYPSNNEVLAYNTNLTEKTTEKLARSGKTNALADVLNNSYATSNQEATLALFEANANISRGVSYTKPRTITLDTKYDGVVAINVWTGYAINVVSKNGNREVVVGPKTRLLNYDETLEGMYLSTGNPKSNARTLEVGYLKVRDNKVSDSFVVQTSDFVDVQLNLAYRVDFLDKYKDRWFTVGDYVKFLCDSLRVIIKREAKKHTIEELYANVNDIIRKAVIEENKEHTGKLFTENGMLVRDIEIVAVGVEKKVANILEAHQYAAVQKSIELSNAAQKMEVTKKLAEYERKEQDIQQELALKTLELKNILETEKLQAEEELLAQKRAQETAKRQAEADLQKTIDLIEQAKLQRVINTDNAKIETEKKLADIEKARQEAYAKTVGDIVKNISPDLVAALTAKANAQMLTEATKAMSPISIAKGESVADTVNTLLRGTTLENVLDGIKEANFN